MLLLLKNVKKTTSFSSDQNPKRPRRLVCALHGIPGRSFCRREPLVTSSGHLEAQRPSAKFSVGVGAANLVGNLGHRYRLSDFLHRRRKHCTGSNNLATHFRQLDNVFSWVGRFGHSRIEEGRNRLASAADRAGRREVRANRPPARYCGSD